MRKLLLPVWGGLQDPNLILKVVRDIKQEAARLRRLGVRKFDPGVTSPETQAVINLSRRTGAKVVTVAGELSDQDFFRKVAGSSNRFFDPGVLTIDSRHGAATHLVQDLVVDLALKRAGSQLRAHDFRRLMGVADEQAQHALGRLPRRTDIGEQLWRTILNDSGRDGVLHEPETLFPLLRDALPGLQ